MKRKKFYKRLLTVVLYFDKENLCKRLQLHDDAKKRNYVIIIFQIKYTKQGKETFLTFSLNSIFSKFPHIHKIRTPYFYYFIFMKHFSRLQLALPMTISNQQQ